MPRLVNRLNLFLTIVRRFAWQRRLTYDAERDVYAVLAQHLQKDACAFIISGRREVAHVK